MCFNDDFIQNLDHYQHSPLLDGLPISNEIEPQYINAAEDESIDDEVLSSETLELAILSAEWTRKEFIGE